MLNELEKLAKEDEQLIATVVTERKKEIGMLAIKSFLLSVIPGMLIGYQLSHINFFAGLLGCFVHLTIVRIYYTKPRVNSMTTSMLEEVQRRRLVIAAREEEIMRGLNNVEQGKVNRDSNE
jgi:uncharacterized membrane protein